ncbi:MAG: hypothetical protein HY564_02250 [Candidatus Jacksonbacteria bacterium]|nr:hypothetical protein [Candidatus Jacksonbacteria bacterium]
MPNNKEELLNLWKEIFSQVYEASYYTQLFACSYLCRSSAHLDTETVKKNLEIIDKHKNFFSQLEYGISYAVVLSIVKLFEPKNRLSLLYLSSEAKKFKITCDDLKNGLAEEDCETLKKLETARHNFFAHRNKEFSEVILPSRDKIFCLLKAIASFLNSIGMNFKNAGLESTHQYLWKEGFAEAVTKDFQLVLDNLYRGERARITEIEVEYSEKL